MALPPWALAAIPGVIQGGANLIQSAMGSRTARRNVDRTNVANMELAKFAHAKDVEMWERQMQYNTPAQQMARFREAGLNPNLIYGQGTPGNVQTHPTFNAPRMDFTGRPPAMDIAGAVSGFHQGIMQSNDRSIAEQKVAQEVNQTWISAYNRDLKELELVDADRANELSAALHGALTLGGNMSETTKIMKKNWVANMTAQEKNNSRTVLLSDFQEEVNRLARKNMQLGDTIKLRALEAALRALGVTSERLNSILREL